MDTLEKLLEYLFSKDDQARHSMISIIEDYAVVTIQKYGSIDISAIVNDGCVTVDAHNRVTKHNRDTNTIVNDHIIEISRYDLQLLLLLYRSNDNLEYYDSNLIPETYSHITAALSSRSLQSEMDSIMTAYYGRSYFITAFACCYHTNNHLDCDNQSSHHEITDETAITYDEMTRTETSQAESKIEKIETKYNLILQNIFLSVCGTDGSYTLSSVLSFRSVNRIQTFIHVILSLLCYPHVLAQCQIILTNIICDPSFCQMEWKKHFQISFFVEFLSDLTGQLFSSVPMIQNSFLKALFHIILQYHELSQSNDNSFDTEQQKYQSCKKSKSLHHRYITPSETVVTDFYDNHSMILVSIRMFITNTLSNICVSDFSVSDGNDMTIVKFILEILNLPFSLSYLVLSNIAKLSCRSRKIEDALVNSCRKILVIRNHSNLNILGFFILCETVVHAPIESQFEITNLILSNPVKSSALKKICLQILTILILQNIFPIEANCSNSSVSITSTILTNVYSHRQRLNHNTVILIYHKILFLLFSNDDLISNNNECMIRKRNICSINFLQLLIHNEINVIKINGIYCRLLREENCFELLFLMFLCELILYSNQLILLMDRLIHMIRDVESYQNNKTFQPPDTPSSPCIYSYHIFTAIIEIISNGITNPFLNPEGQELENQNRIKIDARGLDLSFDVAHYCVAYEMIRALLSSLLVYEAYVQQNHLAETETG
jgi:hypothetical protein